MSFNGGCPEKKKKHFTYPVASIVFGVMAIVSLFLLLFFFSQSQILSGKVPTCQGHPTEYFGKISVWMEGGLKISKFFFSATL